MGRATFYRDFDSLDDVLRLYVDDCFRELKRSLRTSVHKTKAAGERTLQPRRPLLRYWHGKFEILTMRIQARRVKFLFEAFEGMSTALVAELEEEVSPWQAFRGTTAP